jgi:hypothetical protein
MQDTETKTQPKYSAKEIEQLGFIAQRLLVAKQNRDKKHPELNGMSYIDWYEENERLGNTWVDSSSKKGGDLVVKSGTIEQKMHTVLAEISRLNLSPQVRAFDKENNELQKLGVALTEVIYETEERELDEEGKLFRQLELLKQGTVFVQDLWSKEYRKKKTGAKFNGKIEGQNWDEKFEKIFDGPRRKVLYGPGVFLGNIQATNMREQPYIFTVKVTSYQEAASRYGGKDGDGKDIWDRWKYVKRQSVTHLTSNTGTLSPTKVNDGFSLSSVGAEEVEEIHYQDRFNNEYQILLNGVPMLPEGFPLEAVSPMGEYNIEKQILRPINSFFAYGRSFSVQVKELADLLDEMLRLLIVKTRKSIHPPYANIGRRVISPKSLMPGVITQGIDPGSLQKLGEEGQGATASEYQMLARMQDSIDKATVSPQTTGQQGKSGSTAFEVSLLAKQAQKVISLIVFANSLLEKKLGYLRLMLILEKYFEPVDTRVDEARHKIVNHFRKTSRRTNIEGRGSGLRQVIPVEDEESMPEARNLLDMEDFEGTPAPLEGERRMTRSDMGMEPIQKMYLNVKQLRNAKLMFFIEVDVREKDTSNQAKLMFREELRDIQALTLFGSQPNTEELEKMHSVIWNRRKEKLFKVKQEQPVEGMDPQGSQSARAALMDNSSGMSSVPDPAGFDRQEVGV